MRFPDRLGDLRAMHPVSRHRSFERLWDKADKAIGINPQSGSLIAQVELGIRAFTGYGYGIWRIHPVQASQWREGYLVAYIHSPLRIGSMTFLWVYLELVFFSLFLRRAQLSNTLLIIKIIATARILQGRFAQICIRYCVYPQIEFSTDTAYAQKTPRIASYSPLSLCLIANLPSFSHSPAIAGNHIDAFT